MSYIGPYGGDISGGASGVGGVSNIGGPFLDTASMEATMRKVAAEIMEKLKSAASTDANPKEKDSSIEDFMMYKMLFEDEEKKKQKATVESLELLERQARDKERQAVLDMKRWEMDHQRQLEALKYERELAVIAQQGQNYREDMKLQSDQKSSRRTHFTIFMLTFIVCAMAAGTTYIRHEWDLRKARIGHPVEVQKEGAR